MGIAEVGDKFVHMKENGGVGLVYDDRMCAHRNEEDPFHPETPARIRQIFQTLVTAGIVDRCTRVDAREATLGELTSVHTNEHVVEMCTLSGKNYSTRQRTALAQKYISIYFNKGSSSSAVLAAGSVMEICMLVARGELRSGAAVVRPPGHHAEADKAMGFCLFNNVAIAAHSLVHGNPQLGIRKILIVDWDIHHGNGTQHMFWNDPQVLYFSIHRWDEGKFFPAGDDGDKDKVGSGHGLGYNINVPWPHKGFGDLDYLAVFEHVLMPVAKAFNPDLVLISGGFDSAAGDPLGCCEVTPAGYSQMTSKLMTLANGRVVLALEGGYNLVSIANSYLACMKTLLGGQPETELGTKNHLAITMPLVKEVQSVLQDYWPVFGKDVPNEVDYENIPMPIKVKTELSDDTRPDSDQRAPGPDDLIARFSNISVGEGSGEKRVAERDSSNVQSHAEEKSGPFEEEVEVGDSGSRSDQRNLDDSTPTGAISEGSSLQPIENPKQSLLGGGQREGDGHNFDTDTTAHENDEGKKPIINDSRNTSGKASVDVASQDESRASSPLDKDPASTYVWYAGYGSNMYASRFMCYIKGGQIDGLMRPCVGAKDQTPPLESCWRKIPYEMFFGHSETGAWGRGGVSFLDPVSHGGDPSTWIRLYKITLEQFQDVLIQENIEEELNQVSTHWKNINLLGRPGAMLSHSTVDFYEDSWYGAVKYLGDLVGLPILTITCSIKEMQKFREGKLPIRAPSESYKTVILKGLMEQEGSSEEDCEAYLASKIKGIA